MYTTLRGPAEHAEVVKNSEFIALAAPVADVTAALAWLEEVRRRYPDASHVTWAYRVGVQYRFSDDGEPSGTAGAPMFRALEASGLDCVAVAVVRYYGGINLGAGGLARAYGGTAAEVLRVASRLEVHPRRRVRLLVPFDQVNALYRLLEGVDSAERHDEFVERGLQVTLLLLERELEGVRTMLRDATRGQGVLEELAEQA